MTQSPLDSWPAALLGEFIDYLLPGATQRERCPPWPPDVFAVTAAVLQRTGAYVRALELLPEGRSPLLEKGWPEAAEKLGNDWRQRINQRLDTGEISLNLSDLRERLAEVALPTELDEWWRIVCGACNGDHGAMLLREVARPDEKRCDPVCRALLKLCLVADEASAGVGINVRPGDANQDSFVVSSEMPVLMCNSWSSLCLEVAPEKMRVLPKQHTPQRGLTLRSLTHHLALCPANEVEVGWHAKFYSAKGRELDSMNLLLLPWPLELTAREFELLEGPLPALPDKHRFFAFKKRDQQEWFEQYLAAAVIEAKKSVARIDAIVLPELSLSYKEYEKAEVCALKEKALLIAGVAVNAGELGFDCAANVCLLQAAGFTGEAKLSERLLEGLRLVQAKHHRWCLDRDQILQYGLGGVLPASKDCWEYAAISSRSVQFATFGSWLTLSVLICEDLARQDPVADILRAVGPNLVVALLMDGPQLRSRWPARYASVLAEDPGCSVLTLTSLGMTSRSRPRDSQQPNRSMVIALWKDVWYGEQELEMPEGCDAAVLSLVCKSLEEVTADGRGDGSRAHFPVFAGLHPFATGTKKPQPLEPGAQVEYPMARREMP